MKSKFELAMKAISDPTRRTVLLALNKGDKSVSQLLKRTGVEATLLSHHLRILRNAGLVKAERIGKIRIYTKINRPVIAKKAAVILGGSDV